MRFVTSEFVLLELGNALSARKHKSAFVAMVRVLRADAMTEIVPASSELFAAGLRLFQSRRDKDWSLVDCSSFVIMKRLRLTRALAADGHFAQAGFEVLLRH